MTARPNQLDEVLHFLKSKNYDGVTILEHLPTVSEYGEIEDIPKGFPRPEEHHVILEQYIDVPVVAVDFSVENGLQGRVIGYCTGDYWVCADSLSAFIDSMSLYDEGAFFGK